MRKYAFPSISLEVALSTQVPCAVMKAKDGTRVSGTIGGSFTSGLIPWEASLVLAQFLSHNGELACASEVKELTGESSGTVGKGRAEWRLVLD